jgi:hypothetical protein
MTSEHGDVYEAGSTFPVIRNCSAMTAAREAARSLSRAMFQSQRISARALNYDTPDDAKREARRDGRGVLKQSGPVVAEFRLFSTVEPMGQR